MTLGTQTTVVERITRSAGANTITTTSDVTMQYINEGVREFCKYVHGITTDAFISVGPTFDLDPYFAIRFTISGGNSSLTATDVPVCSSTLTDASPTTVMNHVASNVNAALTAAGASASVVMGWSPSTWSFWLSGTATVTAIHAAAPTDVRYADATPLIFGGATSKATSTMTGGFPQDCTVEASLPAGFLEMKLAYFDSWKLTQAPYDLFVRPQTSGTPVYYGVQNKKIRLEPSPSSQKYFKCKYTYMPTDLGVDGSSNSTACPLPEEMHMAPVYYAAAKIFEESHELDKSQYFYGQFAAQANGYKMREANNNPSLFPRGAQYVPYKVVI